MRLIDTSTLELCEFFDRDIPENYAILSHRWCSNEATLQDFEKGVQQEREGFKKIKDFCELALASHIEWAWVDTCCIDKKSSAELTEAINSMYNWYKRACECYVYLSDVLWEGGEDNIGQTTLDQIRKSNWFTRGWTLQELLAPRDVYFFDHDWRIIGSKEDLVQDISDITGIDTMYLLPRATTNNFSAEYGPCTKSPDCRNHHPGIKLAITRKWEASIATRMSWVAKRQTARIEDLAYCMLGIFDVNMPLLYGEGRKAFRRLQHEIIKQSDDDSIFAWTADQQMTGILAPWPINFADSRYVLERAPHRTHRAPYAVTNQGLHLPITWRRCAPTGEIRILLDCGMCGPQGFKNLELRLETPNGRIWMRSCSNQIETMSEGSWYRPQASFKGDFKQRLEPISGATKDGELIPLGSLGNLKVVTVMAD
ncbi:MAG: hypothetical protein Q9168_005452 [Polycauliona sp. 1 TL-2023]